MRKADESVSEDVEYLVNYKVDQLYIQPGKDGAYAKMVGDSETLIGEIDVTPRCKLAVSAFYVREKSDFNSLKITKLMFHKTRGWYAAEYVQVNQFQFVQMKEFLAIISSLNLTDAKKTRLSLDNLNIGALSALLGSSKGAEMMRDLAESPELHHDIYAVATKRKALAEFEAMLSAETVETEWQRYFEANPWIFGHGLNYVALDKVSSKLEAVTTGHSFDTAGMEAAPILLPRHTPGLTPPPPYFPAGFRASIRIRASACWSDDRSLLPAGILFSRRM